jgi:hypothetical protein
VTREEIIVMRQEMLLARESFEHDVMADYDKRMVWRWLLLQQACEEIGHTPLGFRSMQGIHCRDCGKPMKDDL